MDMKHDFTPRPEVRTGDVRRRLWAPEAFAIGAILLVVWAALGVHVLLASSGG